MGAALRFDRLKEFRGRIRRAARNMALIAAIPAALCNANARAQTEDAPLVRIYGTLDARVVLSSDAVESFGQPNAVAITAAGNPVLADSPASPRYTFQVAQTRLGLRVKEQGPLSAQVEIDFVDTSKATPTVASMPRLRIARAYWKVTSRHTLALGQDWDLHAPMNPHGINLVGALFQSGNSGFMRQQIQYLYDSGDVEAGAALGFPFPNNAAKDSLAELAVPPTLSVRAGYRSGRNRVGVSAIATSLLFGRGTPQAQRAPAYAFAFFAELLPGDTTNIRLELNAGQNGANLGLLTLSHGAVEGNIREAGGFLSVRHAFTEKHAVLAMVGTQQVVGAATPLPSYRYSPAPSGGLETPVLAGTGPGMRSNAGGRLGYTYEVIPGGSLVVEGFAFRSRHVLQPQNLSAGLDPTTTALGVEAGILFAFQEP